VVPDEVEVPDAVAPGQPGENVGRAAFADDEIGAEGAVRVAETRDVFEEPGPAARRGRGPAEDHRVDDDQRDHRLARRGGGRERGLIVRAQFGAVPDDVHAAPNSGAAEPVPAAGRSYPA
jgi:hypothetical protein